MTATTLPRHQNNIGVIRLMLACAVIVGHAPELIDGNPGREVVAQVFGNATLGGLAVVGFFLLSGYLITESMLKIAAPLPYLARRFLRIVPGYLVAYVVSLVIVGLVMHLDYVLYAKRLVMNALFLHEPPVMPDLIRLHYHSVNGALWTIGFEFRCYLVVCGLWAAGLLNRRAVTILTCIVVALSLALTVDAVRAPVDRVAVLYRVFDLVVGTPSTGIRFLSIFLVGSCVYLHRDRFMGRLNARTAALGFCASLMLLWVPRLGEIGTSIVAAVPLFYAALIADIGPLRRVNDRWDISYGTYLYGWPVATIWIYLDRSISPWVLVSLTLPIALLLGAASWWGIERWARNLGRTRRTIASVEAASGKAIDRMPCSDRNARRRNA